MDTLEYLRFFKHHTLSKEKNPELFDEKVRAGYLCRIAPSISWIFFDLETANQNKADSIRDGSIIEIGAVCEKKEFSVLCNPGHEITNSHIHGIKDSDVVGKDSTKNNLIKFFEWVQTFKDCKETNHLTVLIAHNAATFDKKVLVNHIKLYNLEEMTEGIVIADSLHPLKSLSPTKQGKLESIYRELFGSEYVERHRALDDSKDLRRIVEHFLEKNEKTYLSFFSNYLYILH